MRFDRPLLCSLLLVLAATTLAGQERRQGGPPPYDPANEVTVGGTVVGTETITPPDRPEQTVLLLAVQEAEIAVLVGPSSWVAAQKFAFTKGAAAEVIGLTGLKYNGRPAMQPRTIRVGSRTLTVRDASGKPVWSRP